MIIVLAALIVIFTWVFAKLFGRGEQTPPMAPNDEIVEHNRQAVGDGLIDDIMFETVLRGYRQDQVDDVIAHLKWQVDSLTSRLAEVDPVAGLRAETPKNS
ncbi:hypothetical protein CDES_05385 [Corynebacterium deserti GIMN1.010]|uniref:DivIVA domain-containing protein n=2 Tax=Corynebacterium TaxID=1716 RepID=A0A0M4CIS7_9CORY|nr:hypothetical protein CDES_05385 [Corynebacterium deserti GIMN1.010]